MNLRLLTALASITLTVPTFGANGYLPTDQYLNLRREYKVGAVKIEQIKASPESFHGKVFEVRGTLNGVARNGQQTTFIIDCSGDCYVASATDWPDASSGASICALLQVGEKSSACISDLIVVAMTSQSEVAVRERKAMEKAEQAKRVPKPSGKAKIETADKQQTQIRFERGDSPQSRSGDMMAEAAKLIPIYKKAIKSFNSKLSDADADMIAKCVLAFGVKYEVDPRLVVSVILAESHFRLDATSPKGAMGLGQLMPSTAAGLGVSNAYDPVENVAGSVRLIRGHLDKISGNASWTDLTWHDLSLALASYNAGAGAVKKYGGVPPYRETQNYINRVFSIYKQLCRKQ